MAPKTSKMATKILTHLYVTAMLICLCSCVVAPGSSRMGFNVQCGVCEETKCPTMYYCEGEAIKDHCNCCTICSSPKYQPHVVIGVNACDKVKCPKLKVCVPNMQGLPLCTCPSEFVCRRSKKKEICGSDGQTYHSKCHMRIAACNQGIAVRKKYKGVCTEKDSEEGGADYRRRLKKLKRKERRKRRNRKRKVGGKEADVADREEEDGATMDGLTKKEERRKKKKKKKERRRKRRKIGPRRSRGVRSRKRRHKYREMDDGSRAFEEAFGHYTWA